MDLDIRQSFLSSEDVHHDENEREENRTKEKQACVGILCHLISWWAKWLVDIVVASTTWIGRGLSCVCAQQRDNNDRIVVDLTPIQEERLQRLKRRVETTFDPKREDHQKSFQRLLQKQQGNRATWEYPFAVAGVNITFMLIQMLDLRSKKPGTSMGAIFLKMLAEDEWAFDLLYCITFEMMDAQWLAMQASYMEFNDVMKATRSQLDRELQMEDVFRLEDMPSYALLSQ